MKKVKKIFNSSKQSITVKDNDETSLKKVRSMYIIGNILSLLDEKKRLYMIKYNKKIQNDLNISLINYQFYTRKLIILEGNNKKGKEYDRYNNILIYEGEYLNGKRNGKGKEYRIDHVLIFEGEYLNGKRNGKGKEYYYGDLIFEGEYLDGKKWDGKSYFF